MERVFKILKNQHNYPDYDYCREFQDLRIGTH